MTVSNPPAGRYPTYLLWLWTPAAVAILLAALTLVTEMNTDWFIAWNAAAQSLPPSLWAGVTNLASTGGAFALLSGILAWQPRWAAAAVLAIPAGSLFTHGLKRMFTEPRPASVLDPDQITVIGTALKANAFPSGHAVTALGIAAAVALCSVAENKRWLAWVALSVAAVAAFSRVAVGAHWPLDIFVGAAGGWLCGAFGVWCSQHWRFWRRPSGVRALALLLGASSLWLFFDKLGYPQGLWAQYGLAAFGCTGALYAGLGANLRGRTQ